NQEIVKAGPGAVVNQAKMAEIETTLLRLNYLITGGAALLGAIFVVLGLAVKSYPVPITITSLVLYLGATAIFALINPMTLAAGAIIKIIIIVALAKSIQTAIAYQNEEATAAKLEMPQ